MLDAPVFKKLAHNDTGQAAGHQGGMVIPKAIEDYFPDVVGQITEISPTADVAVHATMVVGGKVVATVTTRYQYQTWGGKRSPERRLTSGLGPLRDVAEEDDIVLFQRDLDDSTRMVLTLIKQRDPEYRLFAEMAAGRRYGFLTGAELPVGNKDIQRAIVEIREKQAEEFVLENPDRRTLATVTMRKARSIAFRRELLLQYKGKCAVTRTSIVVPGGGTNLDAAHIRPVEAGGSDDPANGLLLCKDFHWAFDRGLFFVGEDYSIGIGASVRRTPQNEQLQAIAGKPIMLPENPRFRPHPSAILWHRMNKALA